MNPPETTRGAKATCLDENDAMRVVLNPGDPRVAAARSHVDTCEACRELVAAVARFVVGDDVSTGAPWSDDELAPGTEVGAYRIVETVGQGAMGRVYLATDDRLQRPVALKLLDPSLQDAVAHARVSAEARAMAQLRHPNVVDVFDVGSSPYGPYVAMLYVAGHDLAGWLDAAPRSAAQILECLEQAGRGLAAAHAAGVVHRDFKPANILVGYDGCARVADFGLASPATVPTAPPENGLASEQRTIAGTPAYMAPEQLAGEHCGPAADQFAYCTTLFEALAGHRPFPETSPTARRQAIERGTIREPKHPIPPIEPRTLRALRRGLSVEPSQRFPDMPSLLAALRSAPVARWKLATAAALVALGVGAVLWKPVAKPPATCGTETPSAWSDASREDVRTAWQQMGAPPYATTRLLQELDAQAGAWTELHRRTCVATSNESTPALRARLDCLEQSRRHLEAFVAAATSTHRDRAEGFATTATQLRSAADCLDDTSWGTHPERAAEVSALKSRHLRDMAQGSTETRPALRAEALAALERGREAEASIEDAKLCQLIGVLDNANGEHEVASQWFERAYFHAKTHAAPALAFDAAAANGLELGTYLHRVPEAQEWFRHARAALGDLDDNERAARLLLHEGDLQMLTNDLDAALVSYRAVEALVPLGVPPGIPASLYGSLGQLFARRGDDAQCREAFEVALSHATRELGDNHRSLIRPLLGIATCEEEPQFYASGLAHLNRAVELSQRHDYALGEAMARGNLGVFYGMLEQPTASLRELLLSDALLRASYPADHFVVGQSSRNVANAYLGTGQWQEAAEAAAAAAQILEAQPLDAASFVFDCDVIAAHANVMLGEPVTTERLEELVQQAPADRSRASATVLLGQAMLRRGRHRDVVTTLAPLYAEDSPEPELSVRRVAEGRLFYAQALLAQGDADGGQQQLERALAEALPYAADDPLDVVQRIRDQL